ncbi:TlpA family protein disulfide reductase [Geobacter pelophilus]|uniref:TlpA family protein disulfide reductase n=1 Tax=Geoanaerobacter pelophilus TaxID=60036 RepID=A0AAW4LCJ4_9BACT|nr:TlpA disulfide reductase family protein [Geoanaerobacter pelophilus]MBT0665602.1 TlpA family protein disulfide reductase [Geoanaerobacter pelophilus]
MKQAFLVTLLLLLTLLFFPAGRAEAVVKIGMNLPAGQFQGLKGGSVRLPDAVRGKVAVIHFWALGCSSCREEMPAMDSIYRKLRARGVEIVAVNMGQGRSEVEKFARETGISYSLVLDPERQSVQLYDVAGIPRTIILDRNGTIRFKIIGSTPAELIRKYVTSLLDS